MSDIARPLIRNNSSQSILRSDEPKRSKRIRKFSPALPAATIPTEPSENLNGKNFERRRINSNCPEYSAHQTSNAAEEPISEVHLEVYSQVFEDIIKQDSMYGGLLINVKKNYDDFIFQLMQTARECQELYQQKTKELQSKNSTINKLERDKNKILNEKKNQDDVIKRMTKDIKGYQAREKKYVKLISSLQDRGYSVETKELTRTRNKSVPKLTIPRNEPSGFHQEFMANYENFSESWRNQINIQNR